MTNRTLPGFLVTIVPRWQTHPLARPLVRARIRRHLTRHLVSRGFSDPENLHIHTHATPAVGIVHALYTTSDALDATFHASTTGDPR